MPCRARPRGRASCASSGTRPAAAGAGRFSGRPSAGESTPGTSSAATMSMRTRPSLRPCAPAARCARWRSGWVRRRPPEPCPVCGGASPLRASTPATSPGSAGRRTTCRSPVTSWPRQLLRCAGLRGLARWLGLDEEDSRARAALRRLLAREAIDTSHFTYGRVVIPAAALREAVAPPPQLRGGDAGARPRGARRKPPASPSARCRTRPGCHAFHTSAAPCGRAGAPSSRRPGAAGAAAGGLPGQPRRDRLHRALAASGVPYACAGCGNRAGGEGVP